MVSLYYKPLTSQMKAFRKQLNEQEINDEIHNLALKEQLNKDNEIYNQQASILRRQDLLNRLIPNHKEEAAYNKAEKEIVKEKAKKDILNNLTQAEQIAKKQNATKGRRPGSKNVPKATLLPYAESKSLSPKLQKKNINLITQLTNSPQFKARQAPAISKEENILF